LRDFIASGFNTVPACDKRTDGLTLSLYISSSCHIYARSFPAMIWGKLWKLFAVVTSLS